MPDQVDWRAIEREATPGRAVGRLLRDQREARGLTVVDIEKRLRIRKNYIEAIENGRFDLLPGAAYIPAFLRAYATHVGLEPEKVLSAYQLAGAVPIKRPIVLPADFPIAEKRAPIGLAVLTVVLVIGAGYAVWNYLPRQQSVVAEKVPPVPDRLLASVPPAKENAKSNPAVVTASVPVVAPAPTVTPVPVVTSPAAVVTPAPVVTSAGSSGSPVSSAAARQEVPPAIATPAPPVVVTVPAPPPPVVLAPPSAGQAQAAQPAEVPQPAPQEARSIQPDPAPTPVVPPPSDILAAKIDTPLLLRANSWIELRAPSGDILAMTYVRAGETYTVPAGISYRVIDAR